MNELPPYPKDAPPMPKTMASLPTYQGWPVPWFVEVIGGVVDFSIVSEKKRIASIGYRLCWICGSAIPDPSWIAFIGSNASVEQRIFFDPGCHEECARYAARVCPYLSNGRRWTNESEFKKKLSQFGWETKTFKPTVPDKMAICTVREYEVIEVPVGNKWMPMVKIPKKPMKVDWDIMPATIRWLPLGAEIDG